MPYQPQTLTQLEACGVTQVHLAALLRFLRCEANGSFAWHAHQGKLERCEYRVTVAAKAAMVARVGVCVCGEDGSE